MGESPWDIAPLALEDCDELGRVHIQVWREAYADHMPADYLASLSEERSAAHWRRTLEQPERPDIEGTTLVARDSAGEIVGFASAGPSRDEDPPTQWELYVINLLARVQGGGLADELVTRLVGDWDATLWVLEANARARGFYARHGFVVEGGRAEHDATGALEIRLIRRQ